jgi:hypothetical protein
MQALSPIIEHFVAAVELVNELDSRNVVLADAARTLWARLARAEDMGCPEAVEDIRQRLFLIGELRREIAVTVERIRARETLQVLGTESMSRRGSG